MKDDYGGAVPKIDPPRPTKELRRTPSSCSPIVNFRDANNLPDTVLHVIVYCELDSQRTHEGGSHSTPMSAFPSGKGTYTKLLI